MNTYSGNLWHIFLHSLFNSAHGFTTETYPEMSHDLQKDRELSEFGLEQYTQTVTSYSKRLSQCQSDTVNMCEFVAKNPVHLRDVNSIINELNKNISEFEKLYTKFLTYLSTLRTSDSLQENSKWKAVLDSTKTKVCDVIKCLKVQNKPSSMTMSGRLSQRSKLSSFLSQGGTKQLGEAVLKHSERLSSAKARLKFAAEEAAILKQEAELNANKIIVSTKREVEEAKCNLEALYDMSDLGESYAPPSNVENDPYEVETVIQRTKSYVDSQSDTRSPYQVRPPTEDESESNLPQRQSDNTVEPTSYFVPSANGVQANNMKSTGFNPKNTPYWTY